MEKRFILPVELGGLGSGHFGHTGRVGRLGGSVPGRITLPAGVGPRYVGRASILRDLTTYAQVVKEAGEPSINVRAVYSRWKSLMSKYVKLAQPERVSDRVVNRFHQEVLAACREGLKNRGNWYKQFVNMRKENFFETWKGRKADWRKVRANLADEYLGDIRGPKQVYKLLETAKTRTDKVLAIDAFFSSLHGGFPIEYCVGLGRKVGETVYTGNNMSYATFAVLENLAEG